MTRPKKVTLENMQAADGEDVTVATKQPRNIYDILGKKTHKYKTSDRDEYVAYIKSLSNSELQTHAYECGILPIDNRSQLLERLLREFCVQTSGYNITAAKQEGFQNLHKDKESLRTVQNIMSRGK